MILLDLFSGYGGFHKGLCAAGFKFSHVYFSEIDKHAIANYTYNYETAEHIGSVEHILESGIKRPDIITFGSPCQDFSIAGKRHGLAGERSSLIEYALTAIAHSRPTVFIWENVK
ncbi:MAG: DNA cytosine methyltransferase [Bacteroidales bacterium]|nr:DNA cytosine methyltransferase [Bacteroidales bacterium]